MRHLLLTLFFFGCTLLLRGAEFGIASSLDISIDYSRDPFYQEIWFWSLVALFLPVAVAVADPWRQENEEEDAKLSGIEEQSGHSGEQDQ